MWQVYFWVFPSGGEEEGEAESSPSTLVQSHVTRSLWLDVVESSVTGHTQLKAMLEQRYTAVSEKLEMITRVLGQLAHRLRGTCLKTRLPIISVLFWENTRQQRRSCTVFLAYALPTLKQAGFPLNTGMLCETNHVSVCDTELDLTPPQRSSSLPPLYSKVRGCSQLQNSVPVDDSAAQLRLHRAWRGDVHPPFVRLKLLLPFYCEKKENVNVRLCNRHSFDTCEQ